MLSVELILVPDVLLPEELLRYLPAYEVVVCTRCQYAIQTSTVSRLLKDIHHINRSSRQPFLQYVSRFDLNGPHNVLQFKVIEFPVPLLPVQDGLSCGYEGCSHLCVTEKRMKSHWASAHGRYDGLNPDWYSVPLQTFFSRKSFTILYETCLYYSLYGDNFASSKRERC